ncbi:MAG: hypothetical protein JO093_04065 [Acidobacteria bacterium]|nr:hypothetical protein [Acidobacteriota bacterium]MBV9184767.1 hypothetical protein [Acidobacteriota bacterium]
MRAIKKHRVALIALAVYHLVFFFPTFFMGRIASPNDVFFNFEPWKSVGQAGAQNPLLNDPPTAYYTVLSLIKTDWRAFHWNPFIGAGVPGFGSTLLAPFSFLPALLLPLPWIYTGIILLKLNIAFWLAYLWLREERLGKRGAAVGAILFAAAGPIAVRWWWHVTNAAPLYPALLWIALRTARGKRTPAWVIGLVALCYALSAFPATMAYGAYASIAYFLYLMIGSRESGVGGRSRDNVAASLRPTPDSRLPLRTFVMTSLAAALGIMIAAPSFIPLAQLVGRSGYLGSRANAAAEHVFPLHHFALFVNPDHLGNVALRDWRGDRALGNLNNYIEATVYVSIVALPLIFLALANRRARSRWFWLAMLAIMLAAMFGMPVIAKVIGSLPGFKYSPLTRIEMMMPIAVAYLAAAGAAFVSRGRFRIAIAVVLAVAAAGDLAVFAGRFYPYLEPRLASPPSGATVAFLQAQPKPFRIAPFFDYLWPNSSELYRLEDVRSHFSSEGSYRRLLERIDPSAALTTSTVINFNSLKFNFDDPLVSMLGVRYFVEQRSIDVMKWTIFKSTKPAVKEIAATVLEPGRVMQRHVRVDEEPFYAIEVPAELQATFGRAPHLDVTLTKGSAIVYTRAFTASDITALGKIYIPLRPYARLGNTVMLRLASSGMRVRMLTGATEIAGDAPLFYDRVFTPLIFERDLPDGRIFRNVAEVPRFHAVTRVRRMTVDELLAAKNIDFADEAIVTDPRPVNVQASDAVVTLRSYQDDEQIVDVSAPAKTLLASSQKLTPELRVTIDGHAVDPVQINVLFAGVPIPPGNHRVVFTQRLGRSWWPLSGIALLLLVALSIVDARRGHFGIATRMI